MAVKDDHVNMPSISYWVHASWRTGALVATLLTLDVSGAFNNAAHRRLIHNLQKRRVPISAVKWIASFLRHRITDILLIECATGQFTTDTGIPQSSPLSPLLYLFYDADLIDQIHEAYPGKALVTGYIERYMHTCLEPGCYD